MILTPAKRRIRRRIHELPKVTHHCQSKGIWVRRPKVTGKLSCVVCGRS